MPVLKKLTLFQIMLTNTHQDQVNFSILQSSTAPITYSHSVLTGNYFGSHFIMGGERFDTPQPESYLFGENSDLNFLGSRPTPVSWFIYYIIQFLKFD